MTMSVTEKAYVIFDMETADPDDLLTLCFLARHPQANLVGVTVTPGAPEQVGLVRTALEKMNFWAPIGVRRPDLSNETTQYKYVSKYYYQVFDRNERFDGTPDGSGEQIIYETIHKFPEAVLLTGAPLGNLRLLLEKFPHVKLQRWVAQGGFAGDSVVPPEYRLEKFVGRETCPTFNFNGDVKGALMALSSKQIADRILVSKNVCHGVAYTHDMHDRFQTVKDVNPGMRLIYRAMDVYLQRHDEKKLHDPLAACVMLNPSICQFEEVEVYREKGEWGSRKKNGTGTRISVSVNRQKFEDTFLLQS